MPGLDAEFLLRAGCAVWIVIAALWLLGLRQGLRPRWMHLVHLIAPGIALATVAILPDDTVLSHALRSWLAAGALILALLSIVWIMTLFTRNASVMDVFYTPCVSLPAVALLIADGRFSWRQVVLAAIIVIWSARLVAHAKRTNLGDAGEQQPYAKWRQQHGNQWWWLSYFQVFMLQGGLVWFFVLPVVLAMTAPTSPFGLLEWIGVGVWLIGFSFQAGADWQLKQFKADPANKGKVLQTGFWSMSRHPNYFGEALMYWSYFVFALAHPLGVLSLVGPLYVTWFMSRGSARPMLDRHMLRTKPDYESYMERVPGFVPFLRSRTDRALREKHRAKRANA